MNSGNYPKNVPAAGVTGVLSSVITAAFSGGEWIGLSRVVFRRVTVDTQVA